MIPTERRSLAAARPGALPSALAGTIIGAANRAECFKNDRRLVLRRFFIRPSQLEMTGLEIVKSTFYSNHHSTYDHLPPALMQPRFNEVPAGILQLRSSPDATPSPKSPPSQASKRCFALSPRNGTREIAIVACRQIRCKIGMATLLRRAARPTAQ